MARHTVRRVARRAVREAKPIFAKVGRTGGLVSEVCLNGDHSVEAALIAAGLNYDEADKVRVNGLKATGSSTLKNHDVVTVSGKIEGGI